MFRWMRSGANVATKNWMVSLAHLPGETVLEHSTLGIVEGSELTLVGAGDTPAEVILLTGQPLGESVARQGPFVMNTEDELRQAFVDFNNGLFGFPTD